MLIESFKSFRDLQERIISPGFKAEHEKHREKHRQQMHDVIRSSYAKLEGDHGYGGHLKGSKKESDAIHDDITHHHIKAVVRDGKVTAVNIYKKQHGRKSIAMGTDGSIQGKKDAGMIKHDDVKMKRAWGEVSGPAERFAKKSGMPEIPVHKMSKLTGKHIKPTTGNRYTRDIGGHEHEKVGIGFPKED